MVTDEPLFDEQVDTICDRFEAEWRAGRRPLIDVFLGEWREPHRTAILRELLYIEVAHRLLLDESPTAQEYYEQFSGDVALIDQIFAAQDTMPEVTIEHNPASSGR